MCLNGHDVLMVNVSHWLDDEPAECYQYRYTGNCHLSQCRLSHMLLIIGLITTRAVELRCWKINRDFKNNLAIANRSRTQYVESSHRPKYYTMTLKSRLRVTRGHWKWNHWSYINDLLLVELFDVKYYRDLEIWVRGYSRSLKVVPFETPSIVMMTISVAISKIFSVKEWPVLEIWDWGLQGHSKWRGSIDHVWLSISPLL